MSLKRFLSGALPSLAATCKETCCPPESPRGLGLQGPKLGPTALWGLVNWSSAGLIPFGCHQMEASSGPGSDGFMQYTTGLYQGTS